MRSVKKRYERFKNKDAILPFDPSKMNLFLSPQKIAEYNKKIEERQKMLKDNPDYLAIASRLDRPIFAGSIDKLVEEYGFTDLKDVKKNWSRGKKVSLGNKIGVLINGICDNAETNQELIVNISSNFFDVLTAVMMPHDNIEHISLELYRYHGTYVCKDPSLKDYRFTVYTLKDKQ